jgi:small subunit ribosomal protein S9
MQIPHGPFDVDPNDFAKFNRINLYDFRRNLPQKVKESKVDSNGVAWGHGKRKRSTALAKVRAGTGKITVNGKPLIEAFHLPSQRHRVLLPLSVTSYTCLLDVELKVNGGGLTGQAEACIPAIARAIQSFDVGTRPTLKYLRLLRCDPRRVERKKPGKIKARKGQVYRRR